MQLLYSNILPLRVPAGQQRFVDAFQQGMKEADRIDIAVGYASKGALKELDMLLQGSAGQMVRLNLGMYHIEGMPEGMYHTAMELDAAWRMAGRGKIRMVRPFKYHGKVYVFYKNGKPFRAFVGSHNLGAICLDAGNRRQYELSAVTNAPAEVQAAADFTAELWEDKCSIDLADIENPKLIREENKALNGVQEVSQLPPTSVALYEKHKTAVSFALPLKVPAYAERMLDDGKHYTKSNINTCYAAPRNKRKNRDWYEIQITVKSSIYRMDGYPEKNHPFFVVTDDGYWFKGHTTSDNNKQFNAVGNELLVGRWLKGRLVAAGLVQPVNDTKLDIDRQGMITKEMLAAYGCDTLVFTKTDQRALDTDGSELDIWILSFEAGHRADSESEAGKA